MDENPYQPPQHYIAPAVTTPESSSATFWFAICVAAWLVFGLIFSLQQALPRDRIWPERLDAAQSDLIHSIVAVSMLFSGVTGVVTTGAGIVAILRR